MTNTSDFNIRIETDRKTGRKNEIIAFEGFDFVFSVEEDSKNKD